MPSTADSVASILAPSLDSLAIVRVLTLKVAADIPDEKLTARACPNSNHAAYILGHIAWTESFFITTFGRGDNGFPQSWNECFGFGVETIDDRGAYPSKQELIDTMANVRAHLEAWLRGCTPDELLAPIEGDLAQFATSRAGLASSLGFHEGFHAGQLSTVRRSLGFPRLF